MLNLFSYYQEQVLRSIEFYSFSLENISTGKSTDAISNVCPGHDSNRPLLPLAVPKSGLSVGTLSLDLLMQS